MPPTKILVIDDSADTRLLLGARLKQSHYTPVFAADAYQAVSIAHAEQPHAILLDLGLPGGGGFSAIQRLKSITTLASVPIVIVTADGSQETQIKALEAGAAGFLVKPVETTLLMETLAKVLEEYGVVTDNVQQSSRAGF